MGELFPEPTFRVGMNFGDHSISFEARVCVKKLDGSFTIIPLPGEVERLEAEAFRRRSLKWFRLSRSGKGVSRG